MTRPGGPTCWNDTLDDAHSRALAIVFDASYALKAQHDAEQARRTQEAKARDRAYRDMKRLVQRLQAQD